MVDESPARRRERYLEAARIDTWGDEVRTMNLGKVGRPCAFSFSMMVFLRRFRSCPDAPLR